MAPMHVYAYAGAAQRSAAPQLLDFGPAPPNVKATLITDKRSCGLFSSCSAHHQVLAGSTEEEHRNMRVAACFLIVRASKAASTERMQWCGKDLTIEGATVSLDLWSP